MNNVVPLAAAAAGAVVVNRWIQRRNVPVVSPMAGLSNRVMGVTVSTGLRVAGAVGEVAGAAVVAMSGAVKGAGDQIDRFTAPADASDATDDVR